MERVNQSSARIGEDSGSEQREAPGSQQSDEQQSGSEGNNSRQGGSNPSGGSQQDEDAVENERSTSV